MYIRLKNLIIQVFSPFIIYFCYARKRNKNVREMIEKGEIDHDDQRRIF
jgi:hypothetical protein